MPRIPQQTALMELGHDINGPLMSFAPYFIILNEQTVKFEDELRLEIVPLCRKELRGAEWKRMKMMLRIRKTPRKYDIIDSGDAAGERHLFEDTDENKTAAWIKSMIEEYNK